MFANKSGWNEQSLYRIFHRCFLPSFSSFGKVISEEMIFRNRPIRNKNCLWRPSLLTNRDEMSNHYRGPSIHAFYQISVHTGKRFQRRRFFRNQPIRNKNGLWWPCLLMDRYEMSNLYRGPSIDASYQISVHLGKRFQRRRFFRNQPIRNKNGLWWVRIPPRRGVLDTTLCDKACQWLGTGWWFSLGTPVSSTTNTHLHDIAEILLKVALNTIKPTKNQTF